MEANKEFKTIETTLSAFVRVDVDVKIVPVEGQENEWEVSFLNQSLGRLEKKGRQYFAFNGDEVLRNGTEREFVIAGMIDQAYRRGHLFVRVELPSIIIRDPEAPTKPRS
jgi:hypothetical protein